jgi:hypothetical protein
LPDTALYVAILTLANQIYRVRGIEAVDLHIVAYLKIR